MMMEQVSNDVQSAERRSNADIIGKMQADLDAYERLCQGKDAEIAALNQQLVAARNEALEEAASIMAPVWGIGCAAAIRALASHPAAPAQPVSNEQGTRSAHWRATGEADPHDNRYDCERAALCMGDLTDDELANEAFLNYDRRPSFDDLIAGKGVMPIAWMTAVKDRIRWLSRSLEKALAAPPVQQTGDAHDQVGCEGDDGLLRVHAASTTCDVCATTRPSAALAILQEICDMQERHYGDGMETHLALINLCDKARAILAASGGALAVPEGCVIVPVEPTDEMLRVSLAIEFPGTYGAFLRHPSNGPRAAADAERDIDFAKRRYAAMIAAAPTTQDTTKGGA